VPASTPIYTYGFNSPALIFYLHRPVRIAFKPDDIAGENGAIIVVAEARQGGIDEFGSFFPPPVKARYENDNYLIFSRKNGG